jgi:glycosyltransferase involved in cell wall biosynthesis
MPASEVTRTAPNGELRGACAVIAAYNEGPAIREVVRGLVAAGVDVVVVDDGSADDTGERARRAGATVLRHELNRGQGAALQTGISYALARGAEIVVTFDADGQHAVDDLPRLIAPLRAGTAEIALGSRFLEGGREVPRSRRALLRAAVAFTRVASGVRLTDAHNGLRAFSRRAAARLDLKLDRMAHASEIVDQIRRSGLPFVEVPVRVRYTEYSRRKGQSSIAALKIAADYLLGRLLG